MCEASAYLIKNGAEQMVLESIDTFDINGDKIRLENIFGEQKTINGRLKEISLVNHKIVFEHIDK